MANAGRDIVCTVLRLETIFLLLYFEDIASAVKLFLSAFMLLNVMPKLYIAAEIQ